MQKKINGLTVLTDYMAAVETVSIEIMVKVGSRDEEPHLNGMSHFLEHMAFKGTRTRSATQIAREFDIIGGNFNAYTGKEKTVYYAKILKEDIDKAFDILSDILQNSVFLAEEIDKERQVIIEELSQVKDTPDDYVFEIFQEVAFSQQALGRSILGTETFIRNVQRQQLIDYINTYYGRNNIIIAVAGNFDQNAVYDLIEEKFQFLPQTSDNKKTRANYTGGQQHLEKDLEQLHCVIGFEGFAYLDSQFYQKQVMSIILGGSVSSRLFQEVREKRGLAYNITSFTNGYYDTGIFGIYSATNPNSIHELIQVIVEQCKLASQHIDNEELLRAVAQIKSSLLMAQESSSARADRIASSYAAFGRIVTIQEVLTRINAITIEDIKQTLMQIIQNEKLPTITTIGRINKVMDYKSIQDLFL